MTHIKTRKMTNDLVHLLSNRNAATVQTWTEENVQEENEVHRGDNVWLGTPCTLRGSGAEMLIVFKGFFSCYNTGAVCSETFLVNL